MRKKEGEKERKKVRKKNRQTERKKERKNIHWYSCLCLLQLFVCQGEVPLVQRTQFLFVIYVIEVIFCDKILNSIGHYIER